MRNKDIKYLVLSDIHFGKQKNPTRDIISNLNKYFDDYRSTSQFVDLDILFIAGDLFDTLLDFASDDIHEVAIWLNRITRFCARFNIKFRILEGTPSHDWRQSKIAETIANLLDIHVDFKYISTLSIEIMEDLDISILYVPDEWTANTDLTFSQVKELLADNNLSQVDICILHGMWFYQARWLK